MVRSQYVGGRDVQFNTCGQCKGTGKVKILMLSNQTIDAFCPTCKGRGTVVEVKD